VLIILLLLLLVGGISAIVAYIRLSSTPETARWEMPWQMPEPGRIAAGLAVWGLTGAPPELIYRQAMATDDLDTAAAQALLTLNLPDNQRLGWMTVLAHRFMEAERSAEARIFVQRSANAAMLMPDLSDAARAQALLQLAQDWAALNDNSNAIQTLEQALIIAQFSSELTPPLRKQLLNDIGQQTIALGETARGQAISAIPVLDYTAASPRTFSLTPLLHQTPNYPESLNRRIVERQQAAQRYIEDWGQRGGQASAGAARDLANHLMDEHLARQTLYRNQLGREDLDPAARIALLYDQAVWLTVQYRVAGGLYGASIVPNWEAERPAIGQALQNAFGALEDELALYLDTLPEEEQAAGQLALARQSATWGILGLLPQPQPTMLADALNQAAAAAAPGHIVPRAQLKEAQLRVELFYQPTAPAPAPVP
jgi:hypothetical protein